jgi:hypothetical protein
MTLRIARAQPVVLRSDRHQSVPEAAARSYEAEWKSIVRGARPPFWRVAWSFLSVPLALETGLAAIAWYGLRLRSAGFIAVFGVAVAGIVAAFVIFLHRSGYRTIALLTRAGVEAGIPWRRSVPCVYELDREPDHAALWSDDDVDEDPRIAEVFGPPPTPEEIQRVRASMSSLRQAAEQRVLGRCVSIDESRAQFNVFQRRVLRRIRRGRLVALHRASTYYVPAWQFRGAGFLPGVDHVIAAWWGSPLDLAGWGERPSVDLDDRTPAQALAEGDVRAVLELEAAIVAASW